MNEDPKIIIDTEGDIPSKFIPKPKVIVGNYGDDMSKLIEAARLAGEGSVIVVDSHAKPELDLKEMMDREADNFIEAISRTGWDMPLRRPRKKVKSLSKCGLPECEKMSAKDYCCAEHCKIHRNQAWSKHHER